MRVCIENQKLRKLRRAVLDSVVAVFSASGFSDGLLTHEKSELFYILQCYACSACYAE